MKFSKYFSPAAIREKGHQFRHDLAYIDALPQLTLLGGIVGLLTGGIIILFRVLIDLPFESIIPVEAENFEDLPPALRASLVIIGCFVIYVLLRAAGPERSAISVSHVLERLHNHQGRMPLANWAVQFTGGAISIITGQSVGREGPAIHLGAGAASQLGQWLKLPNNSLHTLVGCGVAAAIAASFDTPMAGVIFAMEVIVMEYTIVGFVPVILSATIGTALCKAVFPEVGPIATSNSAMGSLWELPILVGAGLTIAVCAALFIRIQIETINHRHLPLSLRIALAAAIGAAAAWFLPEVMGLGYDTLEDAMLGKLTLGLLLAISLTKLCTTAAVVGLGIPGGIVGPTLVGGACIGSAIGIVAQFIFPSIEIEIGFYAILGMAGMMAAIINAPLAALVAVLELSYNPHMIFPSMLVIVIACTSTRWFFGYEGIFVEQLNHSGRMLSMRPAQQVLRRAGVRSVMDVHFVKSHQTINYDEARGLLESKPNHILIGENAERTILNAAHLADWLESRAPTEVLSLEADIDLLSIPGSRLNARPIHEGANLWEALEAMRREKIGALYVARPSHPLEKSVQGLITEEQINNFYLN